MIPIFVAVGVEAPDEVVVAAAMDVDEAAEATMVVEDHHNRTIKVPMIPPLVLETIPSNSRQRANERYPLPDDRLNYRIPAKPMALQPNFFSLVVMLALSICFD